MTKNDSPYQPFIEPVKIPAAPKRARFGNNSQTAEYELFVTMMEAVGDRSRLPDRANTGYESIKRAFRK